MRVAAKALALFVCISGYLTGESLAWFPQNLRPPIFAVSISDGQTAVAADYWGRILITANRGANWTEWRIEVPLYGVSSVSSTNGIAVGDRGAIVRFTHLPDGTFTWNVLFTGTDAALIGVSFVGGNTGTVVGEQGTILRTSDGGSSWTPQDSGTLAALFGVSFIDADNGIAVGDVGTILRTSDGGSSWTPQESGTDRHLQTVSFLDFNTAVAVGDAGTILRTTDGGATWLPQFGDPSINLYGLSFDEQVGLTAVGCLATGDGDCQRLGKILRSTDGGTTWQVLSEVDRPLFAVSFLGTYGTAVGDAGTILTTTDGGVTWRRQASPAPGLRSVSLVDRNIGYAVGDGMFKTIDGGETWERLRGGPGGTRVQFLDANNGFVFGYYLFRTTDGGASWTTVSELPEVRALNGFVTDVTFIDADRGWLVGGYHCGHWGWCNILLRTTDGGATWGGGGFPGGILTGISFADANTGMAAGIYRDHVLRTTDGGLTWTYDSRVGGTAISVVGANTATVVGGLIIFRETIFRTNDGGLTWTRQANWLQAVDLTAVFFVNANIGTALANSSAEGGIILQTTDGGVNWSRLPVGPAFLYGVSFADANTGTVVGENGTILRTNDGH